MGLFQKSKMTDTEVQECLEYLFSHYKLTSFQDKEASIYNTKVESLIELARHDDESHTELQRTSVRLYFALKELLDRSNAISGIPKPAVALHSIYTELFSAYYRLAHTQRTVVDYMNSPHQVMIRSANSNLEYSQKKHSKTFKKALNEEKSLLKFLISSGVSESTLQEVFVKAEAEIATDDWMCEILF